MSKLSKKQAQTIASLVNSAMVGELMVRDAIEQRDNAMAERWMNSKARAIVTLADEYGIELPSLAAQRDRLARSQTV